MEMFKPQKKRWTRWSLWPRVGDGPDGASASVNTRSASPPPQALLGENEAGGAGDMEQRFRKALLDESVLHRKEKESLVQRIMELEKEVEMQKLLDDHNEALNSKKQEFELELEKRRKCFDDEIKGKLDAVDKKKIEIDCKEEQILERNQDVENKMQILKQKEKDFDAKSKALKNWEESIKIDEKKLEKEKQQLGREKQDLIKSINELENLKATVEEAKQQMIKEKKILKVTKEEREHHLLLLSKLKQEIEDCRITKESLLKEREDLRELRKNFEKDWDVLDEKKVELEAEVKKVNDEREKFEKWRCIEKERLNNEVLAAKTDIQRELEDLRLKKETFESAMELEKSNASEELERGRADIAWELDLRKHELEMDMQKKHEDMEKQLQEKESQFNRWRDQELNQINSVKNLNESKLWKLKVEQDQLEREKEELSKHTKKLDSDQLEIQKNIDTLRMLSKNLNDRGEQFIKEQERFLALAKQCRVCKNCGMTVTNFELLRVETEDVDFQSPTLDLEKHMKDKNAEIPPSGMGLHSGTFDAQRVQSDSGVRENEELERLVKAGDDPELSFGIADNSTDIQLEGKQIIPFVNKQNEREGSSKPPENDSLNIQEESPGYFVPTDMVVPSSRLKRRLIFTSDTSTGELDAEDSSLGGRRKRHQISAPGTQTSGEKHYNFRCSTSDGDTMVELSGPSGKDRVVVDYDEDAEKHNVWKKLWTFFTK